MKLGLPPPVLLTAMPAVLAAGILLALTGPRPSTFGAALFIIALAAGVIVEQARQWRAQSLIVAARDTALASRQRENEAVFADSLKALCDKALPIWQGQLQNASHQLEKWLRSFAQQSLIYK